MHRPVPTANQHSCAPQPQQSLAMAPIRQDTQNIQYVNEIVDTGPVGSEHNGDKLQLALLTGEKNGQWIESKKITLPASEQTNH